MAILSALIISIIAEQIIFVNTIFNPEEPTTNYDPVNRIKFAEETTTNNDPITHLKNLAVKMPSTGATNQNGNAQVKRLQGLQNLKLADVVGPRSCPFYHIPTVEPPYLKHMKKLWIVARIVPKGESTYADQTAACGLHNFVQKECKCLRYYLDFEKDETISIQSMSLHIGSEFGKFAPAAVDQSKRLRFGLQSYRYIENRLVFIDKKSDVLQAQHIFSAVINATDLRASSTISPLEEELYAQFEPFALLGTDNFQTYAVYAACTHNTDTPLAWIAFSENAYIDGVPMESKLAAADVLEKNGISFGSTVRVDQTQCLQIVIDKRRNDNTSPKIKFKQD